MRWPVLLMIAALFGGCAEVKPWQRGALAERSMDPEAGDKACSADFLSHTYDVREGSTGGTGKAGGGCGCN